MTTTCVVQARMGSTRLPGKVLADVAGRPLLALLLERLRPLPVEHLVVATSDLERDDPVAEVAAANGAKVVRGPESDVLARFDRALDAHPADVVIRLTGDCPLVDPAIVAEALEVHARCDADYTSNTLQRSYPDGLDVEVIRARSLREAIVEATHPDEREHVTPFVYRRPDRYSLATICSGDSLGDERWTIDTQEDLDWLRNTVAALTDPVRATWRDVLAVVGRTRGDRDLRPECRTGRLDVRRWLGTFAAEPATVEVRVTAPGRGLARYFGPAESRSAAMALVRDLLKADKQVEELEESR